MFLLTNDKYGFNISAVTKIKRDFRRKLECSKKYHSKCTACMLITKNTAQERSRKALNQFHFSSTPLDSSTKNCFHYKNNRDSQSGVPFLLSPQNSHAPLSSSGHFAPRHQKTTPAPALRRYLPPKSLHDFAKIIDFLSGQRELLAGVLSLVLQCEANVCRGQTCLNTLLSPHKFRIIELILRLPRKFRKGILDVYAPPFNSVRFVVGLSAPSMAPHA